jgi:glycosyltransferase involved in cell wall biosynthesis
LKPDPQLSLVIPVFNGSDSIKRVVREIHESFTDMSIEVILVNDGSRDDSEMICRELVEEYPSTLTFVHLSRNFGEHSAVLAGLNHCCGAYVAILDDDGQNPPSEVRRLLDELKASGNDVVYGRYRIKQHSVFRNIGSWFNDRMANMMLKKPRDLYLSSFKVMNRFIVDEITRYKGGFPYIDGLILRSTAKLGQIEVEHNPRSGSPSGYTLRKLVKLWTNMFLNFSILPLRMAAILGMLAAFGSIFLMVAIVIDKLYFNQEMAIGLPTLLVTIVFFSGVQLMILGTIGEYLGRLFLDHSGSPQFVVRYVRRSDKDHG